MSQEPKTRPTNACVNEFIDALEDTQQQAESRELIALFKKASGAEPLMWGDSIIGFDQFPIKYANGRELAWLMTGFSPRKGKFSLYLMDGFTAHQNLLDKLGKYKTGKSCLYVKRLSDINTEVLSQLIQASCAQLRLRSRA